MSADSQRVPTRAGRAIRVLVVDDHDLFRRGLRDLLEEQGIRVVGEASNGEDAVRLAAHARPDVIVMDLHMPRMGGLEATRRLVETVPETKVLVLTISATDADVIEAVAAGASGYILKDASIEEIAAGVRAAAGGEEAVLSPKVAPGLLEHVRDASVERRDQVAELSDRELEILRLLAGGLDNEEIASELVISPRTARNHVSSILRKLELENRVQAAVYAVRIGLV